MDAGHKGKNITYVHIYTGNMYNKGLSDKKQVIVNTMVLLYKLSP